MLSLLCPTRNRPQNVLRLIDTARSMAEGPDNLEFVFYVDDDDSSFDPIPNVRPGIKFIRGPRIVLSEMWNKCYEVAEGPYYMHCGDDIVFSTPRWDQYAINAIDLYKDKIVFAYGDDGSPGGKGFGTHGFIHKNWAETVGYFVPPYFSSDYNDAWLNDVAERIGRKIYMPEVFHEHMHPDWGKGPEDITHQERRQRHRRDNVEQLYADREPERQADADKLRKFIEDFNE